MRTTKRTQVGTYQGYVLDLITYDDGTVEYGAGFDRVTADTEGYRRFAPTLPELLLSVDEMDRENAAAPPIEWPSLDDLIWPDAANKDR
jgi:hypothetical protein